MKKSLFVAVLAAVCVSAAAQERELFDQGNTLYRQGRYQQALDTYASIVESGLESGSLYFNMGNCCYKLQDIGHAVLYYEKALKLSPGDEDVLANLAIANLAVVDRITPLEKHLLYTIADGFIGALPRHTLTGVLTALYLAGMLLVITAVISRKPAVRTAAVRSAVVMGIALVLLGAMLAGQIHRARSRVEAVILTDAVQVKSAPDESAAMDLFTLHEGTRVRVDQQTGGWLEIVLADGKVGWMREEDAGII
ncbi:tetratricopeptide repeat protein [bacterium]|nr:tetratricopeptide repeat protein [bacterium]